MKDIKIAATGDGIAVLSSSPSLFSVSDKRLNLSFFLLLPCTLGGNLNGLKGSSSLAGFLTYFLFLIFVVVVSSNA